jgi:phospholipid/cholesterol/gamma-HCH transport system substrate-binding protein
MASDLVKKVSEATDRVNQMLGPENQTALHSALTEFAASAKSINQLAANTDKVIQGQFGPGKLDVPALARQTDATLRSVQTAADQTRQTAANLNTVANDLGQGVQRLTASGGVIDRLSESASTVTATTLPRIQLLTEDASRTIRRLDRVVDAVSENPQAFIYGSGAIPPGPGEAGFVAPGAAPSSP